MASHAEIEPLRYPEDWPEPSGLELACRRVPVVGWIAGTVFERHRTRSIVNEFDQKLEARPPTPPGYWDNKTQQRIAQALIRSCVEACGWAHSHFVPDDSFGVMLEWKTGDGCEWDAMFRIEKTLGVELGEEQWIELSECSLQEAIEYLADRAPAS